MKSNHYELTLQLWDLLTQEETEKGYVYITYDVDTSTLVYTGSSMVDEVLRKCPYRDHVIGFKRERGNICVSLDEEGQKNWDEEYNKIAEFYSKY